MINYGNQQTLLGALGVIGLALSTDKSSYLVGEKPLYTVTAAIPGSAVTWSSYKDEVATAEHNVDYGHVISPNGTAELEGGAWTESDVGRWQKEVIVTAPDGTMSRAEAFFVVRSSAPVAPGTTPAPSTGILDQQIDLPLVGRVPLVGALAAGGLAIYLLTKKR